MVRSLLNSRSLYHRAAFAALCVAISGGPAAAKATYTTFGHQCHHDRRYAM